MTRSYLRWRQVACMQMIKMAPSVHTCTTGYDVIRRFQGKQLISYTASQLTMCVPLRGSSVNHITDALECMYTIPQLICRSLYYTIMDEERNRVIFIIHDRSFFSSLT